MASGKHCTLRILIALLADYGDRRSIGTMAELVSRCAIMLWNIKSLKLFPVVGDNEGQITRMIGQLPKQ